MAFIVSAQLSGKGNGCPYIETAQNRRSRVLKPPTSGARNEIQSLAYVDANSNPITPNGGTYDLVFGGQTTSDINASDDAATIQGDLRALSSIGSGNVNVTGSGPFSVEFVGALAGAAQSLLTVANNSLVAADNAISVTTTTPSSPAVQNVWQLAFDQGGDGSASFELTDAIGSVGGEVTAFSSASDVQGLFPPGSAVVVDSGGGSSPFTITFNDGVEHSLSVIDNAFGASDDGSDCNPVVTEITPCTGPGLQSDTITLGSNVSGGNWMISSQGPLNWNQDSGTVLTAIEADLSISGGSISGPNGGPYVYTYGTAGDQTAETSQLLADCNTGGNALTQVVTVSVTETQHGG